MAGGPTATPPASIHCPCGLLTVAEPVAMLPCAWLSMPVRRVSRGSAPRLRRGHACMRGGSTPGPGHIRCLDGLDPAVRCGLAGKASRCSQVLGLPLPCTSHRQRAATKISTSRQCHQLPLCTPQVPPHKTASFHCAASYAQNSSLALALGIGTQGHKEPGLPHGRRSPRPR